MGKGIGFLFKYGPIREQLLSIASVLEAQNVYRGVFQILLKREQNSLSTFMHHCLNQGWELQELRPQQTELMQSLWSQSTQGVTPLCSVSSP